GVAAGPAADDDRVVGLHRCPHNTSRGGAHALRRIRAASAEQDARAVDLHLLTGQIHVRPRALPVGARRADVRGAVRDLHAVAGAAELHLLRFYREPPRRVAELHEPALTVHLEVEIARDHLRDLRGRERHLLRLAVDLRLRLDLDLLTGFLVRLDRDVALL